MARGALLGLRTLSEAPQHFRLVTLLTLLLSLPCHAQLVINEVLADNRSAVPRAGAFLDYLELHNRGTTSVSLAGMSLTDDPALPRRFVFGAGLAVAAGGYFVVWADTTTIGFGLSARGERLLLYAADGVTLVDEIAFGLQVPDLAIGRRPDSASTWSLVHPSPGQANALVTLSPASALRLNEWMARPVDGEDWIELFNAGVNPAALSGLILTDSPTFPASNRPIPALSFIAARGYVQLFASDLADQDADHLDFKLSTSGETLTLLAGDRLTILDQVTFGAQTTGMAQGRAPDGGEILVFFPAGAESPGKSNFAPLTEVAVSEVLSHTDPPFEDAIELVNLTTVPQDVSHWWLSDSAARPRKYRIAAGTVIPPNGFVVFYEYQVSSTADGFSLNSFEGDEVFLSAGDAQGNLTGRQTFVTFGALANSVSAGRYETSQGVHFVPLSRPTFGTENVGSLAQFRQGQGAANAAPRVGPLVISEIGFRSTGEADPAAAAEFVELYNPTASPVTLHDPAFPTNAWRLRGGVTFDFPFGVTIQPGGFVLVVDFDPTAQPATAAAFRQHYAVTTTVPLLGPFLGGLSHRGEMIELQEPDEPEGPDDPNAGFVPYLLIERIEYASAAPWPVPTEGVRQSLHRQRALEYGNDPVNWQRGPPTPGSAPAADTDRDGMTDAWETAHGMKPAWAGDAALDPDQDRAVNLTEFVAGTDPQDGGSVLAITRVTHVAGTLRLVFPVVAGRSYELCHRQAPDAGTWEIVASIPAVTETRDVEWTVPLPANASGLYRLSAQFVP